MKKIVLGIAIGVVLTLSAQYGWRYYQSYTFSREAQLFSLAKFDLQHKLKGARVLDVSIGENSKAIVNYIYDKLYDVHFSYVRDGKIKHITVPYGYTKGTWITPNRTTFEILDNEAKTDYDETKRQKK